MRGMTVRMTVHYVCNDDECEMTLKKDTDAITNNITNHILNMNMNANANVMTLATMKTNVAGYAAIGYVYQTQITVHRSSSKS